MATACLHLFCGKAGAGKSTLARAIARERGALLVEEDAWLQQLFADELRTFDDYVRFSRRLRGVVGPLVVDTLRAGRDVVLDFPANTTTARAWHRSLFEAAGADHVLHFIDSTDAACLQRIDQRNRAQPERHLTPELFAHVTSFFQPPTAQEGLVVRRYPDAGGSGPQQATS